MVSTPAASMCAWRGLVRGTSAEARDVVFEREGRPYRQVGQHPEAGDEQLASMHAGGIRGLRFTQHDPKTAVSSGSLSISDSPGVTPKLMEPRASFFST